MKIKLHHGFVRHFRIYLDVMCRLLHQCMPTARFNLCKFWSIYRSEYGNLIHSLFLLRYQPAWYAFSVFFIVVSLIDYKSMSGVKVLHCMVRTNVTRSYFLFLHDGNFDSKTHAIFLLVFMFSNCTNIDVNIFAPCCKEESSICQNKMCKLNFKKEIHADI